MARMLRASLDSLMEPDSLALPGKNFDSHRRRLNPGIVISILWDSAFKSFWRAFFIKLFGSIALGIAGDIWRSMMPSNGPGISIPPGHWINWSAELKGHWFGIIWTGSFIALCVFRFARFLPDARHRKFAKRLRAIDRKVSEHWFGLIVGNAIGAMVSALVINSLPQFTWNAILWKELVRPMLASVFHLFVALVGPGAGGAIQGWVSWYSENTLQFTFWGLYLAAAADDLGLPNIKTLGRWLRKRLVARINARSPVAESQTVGPRQFHK